MNIMDVYYAYIYNYICYKHMYICLQVLFGPTGVQLSWLVETQKGWWLGNKNTWTLRTNEFDGTLEEVGFVLGCLHAINFRCREIRLYYIVVTIMIIVIIVIVLKNKNNNPDNHDDKNNNDNNNIRIHTRIFNINSAEVKSQLQSVLLLFPMVEPTERQNCAFQFPPWNKNIH